MSKKYIEFRVTGFESELKNFSALLQLIQSFGRFGMSRKVEVHIDGDGSGRLNFEVIKQDGEKTEFPSFEHEDLQKIDKMSDEKGGYSIYIGE